jgi:hypothetical protein
LKSREIGIFFGLLAQQSLPQIASKDSTISFFEWFKTQQLKVIDFILKEKIKPKLEILVKSKYSDSLLNSFEYELRKDLLHFSEIRSLRARLEEFAQNKEYSKIIKLKTLNLEIRITKDDLVDMGFIEWGSLAGTNAMVRNNELNSYISTQTEFMVDRVAKELDFMVTSNQLGKGKVILVPITSTEDPNLGFQVLDRLKGSDYETSLYNWLPDSGVFKIDSNDPDYKQILRHCAYLMLSDACGFVMKTWKENIYNLQSYLLSDTEMIVGFTRNRILSPEDIYSKSGTWSRQVNVVEGGDRKHVNIDKLFSIYPLKVTGYSQSIRYTQTDWSSLWRFPHVWTKINVRSQLYRYMLSISPYLTQELRS